MKMSPHQHSLYAHTDSSGSSSVGGGSSLSMALGSLLPLGSPTQQGNGSGGSGVSNLSASASARRKGRVGSSTPYSRPSSGSGTPRGEKRKSTSGEMLAALSRPTQGHSSGTASPGAGLTPSSVHMLDFTGASEESVCSSISHSPLMADPFLFAPSSSGTAVLPSSLGGSGPNSLANSMNSSWSASGRSTGVGRFGPGVGLMGHLNGDGGVGQALNRLSMSTGHMHREQRAAFSSASTSRRPSGSHLPSSSATGAYTLTPMPTPPSHFASTFLNLGPIGRGSFGICYHVLQTAVSPSSPGSVVGCEYAVKKSIRPFKGENDRSQKMREVDNWRFLMTSSQQPAPSLSPAPAISCTLDHLHLVRYYSAWEELGHLYIQSELFRSGTVRHFLSDVLEGPVDEELLWVFLLDLARGLRCMHTRGLVHLDLKWDNCFIATAAEGQTTPEEETGILKIGDFGLSVNMNRTAGAVMPVDMHDGAEGASSFTPGPTAPAQPMWHSPDVSEGDQTYLAPEFMDSSLVASGCSAVSPAADMFSLGMMLFEAAFDVELPSRGAGWIDLRNERIDWTGGRYNGANTATASPASPPRSPELLSLIRSLLRRSPAARPSVDEILTNPTLIAFARGDRGRAQRSLLRHLPSLLPPSSVASREEAAKQHAEAQAAQAQAAAQTAQAAVAPEADMQMHMLQADTSTRDAPLQPEDLLSELDSELLRYSAHRSQAHEHGQVGLRSTRTRAAASSAARSMLEDSPVGSTAMRLSFDDAPTEDGLTPKNLFSAFDATDDD
jgi:serine/threonine protein kinase